MPTRDYTGGNNVRFIHGGEEYFNSLLDVIDGARKFLHLQVYILDRDETGLVVIDALKDAAKRGVNVYLVVDGFGSMSLGREFEREMKDAGVFFRFFSPLPFPGIFQAGRRLHHKVCVADGKTSLVGGINISNKYRGDGDELPWLDYALQVEGPLSVQITAVCERIFRKRFTQGGLKKLKRIHVGSASQESVLMRMSVNDWIRRKNEISAAYKHMLSGAHKEVIIVASYFIPTRRLLKILIRSAKRGRKIYIILSRTSDVPFMKAAISYLYDQLLSAGVQVFEYRASVLHAKVCVVDNRWVSVGSHNLNHLSELISIEMNLEVLQHDFALKVSNELKQLMKEQCQEIRMEEFDRTTSTLKRGWNWFSYKLISLSMRLLYFLNQKGLKDR